MGLTNKLQFILAPEPPIPTRREHYNYNWNLVDEKLGGILDGTIKASEATHAVNADNADKVDGFDASQTPVPNTIVVANNLGKIDINWLPSGLNADKVDGFDASQTPTANTIPVSDNTGKLNLSWIPQGSGSGLDADKVDGFDASAFALANHTHDSNGILNGAITKSKLAISVRRRMLAYGFILGG
ncbi:hypothetical protein [Hydrogenobacter thermophilus]|uniref:hypothetical protein n=1 Tax=Hydrogenobacter thermophilus TaxID=940 RepID=UPI0030FB5B3C